MKVTIDQMYNGFVVSYSSSDDSSVYVYKATEDFMMIEDVCKKLLKRKVKIEEK